MSGKAAMLRRLFAALALTFLASCSPVFQYHGFVPSDEDLAEIEVGLDTRSTVGTIIGRPGAAGLLADSGWYYVRSEFKHETFHAPEEIDRQVVAISFDKDGVVSNIERFGLERGQVVVLSRRVTDSNIEGVSFLKQLFGDLGSMQAFKNLFQ